MLLEYITSLSKNSLSNQGKYTKSYNLLIIFSSSSNTTQILPSYTIVQNKTNALLSFNHSPKDWIISNHTSYLDPFVLSSIFTPIFYSLSSINSNNEPIPIPPWSFIKSEHTSSTTTTTASTLPTSVNGPKALFPEASCYHIHIISISSLSYRELPAMERDCYNLINLSI